MSIEELVNIDLGVEMARLTGRVQMTEQELDTYRRAVGLARFNISRGLEVDPEDAAFIRAVATRLEGGVTGSEAAEGD